MANIRVLIVDDSVVVRQMVSKALAADPGLDVVGVAASGPIALAKIPQVNPDVIILDLDMPEMDGLATLQHIQQTHPHLPVIMFSALTQRGAIATLDALAQGAKDYLTKPSGTSKEEAIQYVQTHLIPKIKVFYQKGQHSLPHSPSPSKATHRSSSTHRRSVPLASPLAPPDASTRQRPTVRSSPSTRRSHRSTIKIIAIGVSTGGPDALAKILPALPADLSVPIVIVQHMPPLFTQRLAERLNNQSQLQVVEGANGMVLQAGMAAIAPGNFHMVLESQESQVMIRTHQAPPENSCRPAVDVLFRSVVRLYGAGTLGVILTGMGQDGFHGCQHIRDVGGYILAQDEASSVVWGMPGIVVGAGLADQVLSLDQIATGIMDCLGGR